METMRPLEATKEFDHESQATTELKQRKTSPEARGKTRVSRQTGTNYGWPAITRLWFAF